MSSSEQWIDKLYLYSIDHFVNWRKHLKEYAWAIVVALVIRSMVLTIYKIPTGSMIPTFREGDVLIASRFYYGIKLPFTEGLPGLKIPVANPKPGDVVIFRSAGEADFYAYVLIPKSEQAVKILFAINENQDFPRTKWIYNNFTNRIFERASYWINQFPTAPEMIGQRAVIELHPATYAKYKETLNDPSLFEILKKVRNHRNLSFPENSKPTLLASMLDAPLSGLAILGTVTFNTPLGFLPKFVAFQLGQSLKEKSDGFANHLITGMSRWQKFTFYPNPAVDTTKDYVKRMLAREGDVVEIVDKHVIVNGVPHQLDKTSFLETDEAGMTWRITTNTLTATNQAGTYQKAFPQRTMEGKPMIYPVMEFPKTGWPFFPEGELAREYTDNFGPITVPKGYVFVMGDNRDNSFDARFWGCVPLEAIKGKALIRLWPFNRFGLID